MIFALISNELAVLRSRHWVCANRTILSMLEDLSETHAPNHHEAPQFEQALFKEIEALVWISRWVHLESPADRVATTADFNPVEREPKSSPKSTAPITFKFNPYVHPSLKVARMPVEKATANGAPVTAKSLAEALTRSKAPHEIGGTFELVRRQGWLPSDYLMWWSMLFCIGQEAPSRLLQSDDWRVVQAFCYSDQLKQNRGNVQSRLMGWNESDWVQAPHLPGTSS